MLRTASASIGPTVRRCSGGSQPFGDRDELGRGLAAVGDQEHAGTAGEVARPLDDRADGIGCRGVEVVDDGEEWALARGPSVLGRGIRVLGRAGGETGRRQVDDGCARVVGDGRELGGQAGLADARGPGQDHGSAVTVPGASPVPGEPAQLGLAASQGHDRVEPGWQRRGFRPGRRRGHAGNLLEPVRARDPDRGDRLVVALERGRLEERVREAVDAAGKADESLAREHLARPGDRAHPGGEVEGRPRGSRRRPARPPRRRGRCRRQAAAPARSPSRRRTPTGARPPPAAPRERSRRPRGPRRRAARPARRPRPRHLRARPRRTWTPGGRRPRRRAGP